LDQANRFQITPDFCLFETTLLCIWAFQQTATSNHHCHDESKCFSNYGKWSSLVHQSQILVLGQEKTAGTQERAHHAMSIRSQTCFANAHGYRGKPFCNQTNKMQPMQNLV
jgi:hypothetical protein